MKTNTLFTALSAMIGVAALVYVIRNFKGGSATNTTDVDADGKTTKTPPSASKNILTLDKITVNIPQREFILKDRQKFLDDWAAGEGGVQSIRDMYKKRPSAFPKADIVYLQSNGILPSENLAGRGITTTIV